VELALGPHERKYCLKMFIVLFLKQLLRIFNVHRSPFRCATSRTVPGSIPGGVTWFFSDILLQTVPWPWGRLSPLWNEYQEHILGVKAARAWGWQPHHLHVMKSGSLKLLEPSGPHRACYGTPLPLTFTDNHLYQDAVTAFTYTLTLQHWSSHLAQHSDHLIQRYRAPCRGNS
jgi:hypothetical protein